MKALQLHVRRRHHETDPRAPGVQIYPIRKADAVADAVTHLGVVRFKEETLEEAGADVVLELIDGVDSALEGLPIATMALDESMTFEVYEIVEHAPHDGSTATALVEARLDIARLCNLQMAREAGWAARIAGAGPEPKGPFVGGELAETWSEGWRAADDRIENSVLTERLSRFQAASFEVVGRRAYGAMAAARSTTAGFTTVPPWDDLPADEKATWRRLIRAYLDHPTDDPGRLEGHEKVAFKAARALGATFRSFNLEL